jgi:hypothetical protein
VEKLISDTALAFIKRYQPNQCANPDNFPLERNNLWIISELDVIDKHRILIIGAQHFRALSVSYTVNGGPPIEVPVSAEWKPLIDGAEIATIDTSAWVAGVEYEVRVNVQSEEQVCFSNNGLSVDGQPVLAALIPCIQHVESIVAACDTEFFK